MGVWWEVLTDCGGNSMRSHHCRIGRTQRSCFALHVNPLRAERVARYPYSLTALGDLLVRCELKRSRCLRWLSEGMLGHVTSPARRMGSGSRGRLGN
jgi:hypothetical protein